MHADGLDSQLQHLDCHDTSCRGTTIDQNRQSSGIRPQRHPREVQSRGVGNGQGSGTPTDGAYSSSLQVGYGVRDAQQVARVSCSILGKGTIVGVARTVGEVGAAYSDAETQHRLRAYFFDDAAKVAPSSVVLHEEVGHHFMVGRIEADG